MMAKMIGDSTIERGECSCCIAPSWRKTLKRRRKRAERQAFKRDVASGNY